MTVAREVLGVHNGGTPKIMVEGPAVRLPPKAAVTIAMALHELCTNAMKYGSLSTDGGRVSLRWSLGDSSQPRFTLVWRETGGPPTRPPVRRGFGSQMIERALALELHGTAKLDFRPDGLVCEIDAPAPQEGHHVQS
jgi:two-component sensor histidine kinase